MKVCKVVENIYFDIIGVFFDLLPCPVSPITVARAHPPPLSLKGQCQKNSHVDLCVGYHGIMCHSSDVHLFQFLRSLDLANDQRNSIKPSRYHFFFVQLLRKSSSPRFQSLAWTSRPTCSAFLLTFSRRKSQPLLLLSTISLSDFQRNHQVLKICTISKRGLEIMLFLGITFKRKYICGLCWHNMCSNLLCHCSCL